MRDREKDNIDAFSDKDGVSIAIRGDKRGRDKSEIRCKRTNTKKKKKLLDEQFECD